MDKMDEETIDLVVTSPPYDNLRNYNGYTFDFCSVADKLYKVIKPGGVVVWIITDGTIKGAKTGTSFKQALYFQAIGFNIHDTMIWNKGSYTAVGALKSKYGQVYEFMFIFSKGRPKTFNPIKDRKNKYSGQKIHGTRRYVNGNLKPISDTQKEKVVSEYGQRFNIWELPPEKHNTTGHPAVFPEYLVHDHIISWSNENDLVYDPFMGSGTTAIAAIKTNRNYIGSEISKEYFNIINQRIETMNTTFFK